MVQGFPVRCRDCFRGGGCGGIIKINICIFHPFRRFGIVPYSRRDVAEIAFLQENFSLGCTGRIQTAQMAVAVPYIGNPVKTADFTVGNGFISGSVIPCVNVTAVDFDIPEQCFHMVFPFHTGFLQAVYHIFDEIASIFVFYRFYFGIFIDIADFACYN